MLQTPGAVAVTGILKDLRHAVRVLLRTKSWTSVVLVSLALGIGANAALFTAVNGLLLQTIPVPRPSQLVRLKWAGDNDMVRSSSDYGISTTTTRRQRPRHGLVRDLPGSCARRIRR